MQGEALCIDEDALAQRLVFPRRQADSLVSDWRTGASSWRRLGGRTEKKVIPLAYLGTDWLGDQMQPGPRVRGLIGARWK